MLVNPDNNIIREKKVVIYRESTDPQARNPIFQKPGHYGCPYCTDKRGRKKHYQNLWHFYMHLKIHHPHENFQELIKSLAEFVIRGVLL